MSFTVADSKLTLEQKNKLFEQMVFIHQALTQKNQYFVSEFEVAKDAIVTITTIANDLKAQIDAETPKEQNEPSQAV